MFAHQAGKLGFGKWHLLRTCQSGHQSPRINQGRLKTPHNHANPVYCNLAPLMKITDALDSYVTTGGGDDVVMSSNGSLAHVANRIHQLLDKLPHKATGRSIEHIVLMARFLNPSAFCISRIF